MQLPGYLLPFSCSARFLAIFDSASSTRLNLNPLPVSTDRTHQVNLDPRGNWCAFGVLCIRQSNTCCKSCSKHLRSRMRTPRCTNATDNAPEPSHTSILLSFMCLYGLLSCRSALAPTIADQVFLPHTNYEAQPRPCPSRAISTSSSELCTVCFLFYLLKGSGLPCSRRVRTSKTFICNYDIDCITLPSPSANSKHVQQLS